MLSYEISPSFSTLNIVHYPPGDTNDTPTIGIAPHSDWD